VLRSKYESVHPFPHTPWWRSAEWLGTGTTLPFTPVEHCVCREGEEEKFVTCCLVSFKIPIWCSTSPTRYFTTRHLPT
jgi:hypothetical protein